MKKKFFEGVALKKNKKKIIVPIPKRLKITGPRIIRSHNILCACPNNGKGAHEC